MKYCHAINYQAFSGYIWCYNFSCIHLYGFTTTDGPCLLINQHLQLFSAIIIFGHDLTESSLHSLTSSVPSSVSKQESITWNVFCEMLYSAFKTSLLSIPLKQTSWVVSELRISDNSFSSTLRNDRETTRKRQSRFHSSFKQLCISLVFGILPFRLGLENDGSLL